MGLSQDVGEYLVQRRLDGQTSDLREMDSLHRISKSDRGGKSSRWTSPPEAGARDELLGSL